MGGKLFGAVTVVCVIAAAWWVVMDYVASQDSFQIAIAFGIPLENDIEMHALASQGMTQREPPRVDRKTLKMLWQDWADEHFDLRDGSGAPVSVAFRESTETCVIPAGKMVESPVGYLYAKLQQGTEYTFDYIPKRAETKRYRHTFTAPSDDTPVARLLFDAQ